MKLKGLGGRLLLLILTAGAGLFVEGLEYKNLKPLVEGKSLYSPGPPEIENQIQSRPLFGAVHGKCYNTTGETFKGETVLKQYKHSDLRALSEGFNEAARSLSDTQTLYTTTPNCPISFCVKDSPWNYKFCVRPGIEDLRDIRFYRSEIARGSTWITWLFTDYVEGVACKVLPPLPRKSDSEPILFASMSYQKNFTVPRDKNPELLPWELQLWYGGCSLQEIRAAKLKPYPPGYTYPSNSSALHTWLSDSPKTSIRQSTSTRIYNSSTATVSSTMRITPTSLPELNDIDPDAPSTVVWKDIYDYSNFIYKNRAKSEYLVKRDQDVPLNDRGWFMRCHVDPLSMPFQQNATLATISNIKESIRTGSIQPVFDYQPHPENGCRQHYCDPSTNVKVSLCGEASVILRGNLYLDELIEKTLHGLVEEPCYEGRNITSNPRFYRISHLHWLGKSLDILGPQVMIGQLEAGMSCDAFFSKLQLVETSPLPLPLMPSNSSSILSIKAMTTTYHTVPLQPLATLSVHMATPDMIMDIDTALPTYIPPMPNVIQTSKNKTVKEFPYYLKDFTKTGKGGNSLWLFNETEKTGGLDPNGTIKLQKGLYKNMADKKFETFENFPDFIVEFPADREAYEGDCSHYYCDDASKALISMCGKWWNGLPAPYADTVPPSYNVNAGRLIGKSRWLTYFCNAVGQENTEWTNTCDIHDYSPEYQLEQSKIPLEQRRPYPFARGLVREFSPEDGMIGPAAFRVEHLSLHGVDNCYDWNQTLFLPINWWMKADLKILYDSGKRYEKVGNSTSTSISTPTTSLIPSQTPGITVSITISNEASSTLVSMILPTDTMPNVLETTGEVASLETPASSSSKWVLEPPPTPVGPDRPDPTEKPQPEDPKDFRVIA
ncbi:hypothetical protein TWF106_010061 [Orbilia oligospora]|uniref:Uncharacterized protein n=1 Tax=Orbilia oligospora TaxID=2813651 RepID=A0A7C8UE17_ORBOL|nr:hypothetical protein TWF106_010061 [Orbilia oligospora]